MKKGLNYESHSSQDSNPTCAHNHNKIMWIRSLLQRRKLKTQSDPVQEFGWTNESKQIRNSFVREILLK